MSKINSARRREGKRTVEVGRGLREPAVCAAVGHGGAGEDGLERHERIGVGDVGGGGGAGDGDGQEEGAVVCVEGCYGFFGGALAVAGGAGVGCGGAVAEKRRDADSARGGAHWDGAAGRLPVCRLWKRVG